MEWPKRPAAFDQSRGSYPRWGLQMLGLRFLSLSKGSLQGSFEGSVVKAYKGSFL